MMPNSPPSMTASLEKASSRRPPSPPSMTANLEKAYKHQRGPRTPDLRGPRTPPDFSPLPPVVHRGPVSPPGPPLDSQMISKRRRTPPPPEDYDVSPPPPAKRRRSRDRSPEPRHTSQVSFMNCS